MPSSFIKYFINWKPIFLFIVLLLAASFYTAKSFGEHTYALENDRSTQQRLLYYVALVAQQGHYNPRKFDDSLSSRIFVNYLRSIDNACDIFLQEDIKSLSHLRYELDDEILNKKPIVFIPLVSQFYNQRIVEADSIRKKILSTPFDYSIPESYQSINQQRYIRQRAAIKQDYENPHVLPDILSLNFSKSKQERYERWRKKLKSYSIEVYANMLNREEKMREKNDSLRNIPINSDSLEREAREVISRRYDRFFNRMYKHFDEDDRFELYLSTIMRIMDPHSNYLSPVDARSYEESTSGKFYGIGALLTQDGGYVKIVSISTGGAAWKSKQLDPDDLILKVGQGRDSSVDIVGYDVREAVRIIRGDKGTEVHLTVKKQDGSIRDVYLMRGKIFMNQTFARSAIISYRGKRGGYIYLPEFYNSVEKGADGKQNPQSAEDVKKALVNLQKYGIDGVVIDLRNNGGGYLYDAIKMAGFFIPNGPIVQVKNKNKLPISLADRDTSVVYDGPLVVMINEYSASASEIFAAAMQDYKRGVVVGARSSYGKGTVQKGGLSFSRLFGEDEDIGSAHLTIQKFYRVSGQSTQLKGVLSDVIFPSSTEYVRRKERDIIYSLSYDSVQSVPFSPYNPGAYNYTSVANKCQKVISSSSYYKALDQYGQWLANLNETPTPLDIKKYRDIIRKRSQYTHHIDSLRGQLDKLKVTLMKADSLKYTKLDSAESGVFFNWYKDLCKDVNLQGAVRVLNSMIVAPHAKTVYADRRKKNK